MRMEGLPQPSAVLFTDLDGTLLDHSTYQPGPAAVALQELIEGGVLVVLCSAKTRAEQTHIQSSLGFDAPFIVENGAAIADPRGILVSFGLPYETVVERLASSAEEAGVRTHGYDDMSLAEISDLTGLSEEEADRARTREFSVTFLMVDGGPDEQQRLQETMARRGLRMVRGARFLSAQGQHDKGVAVRHLVQSLRDGNPTLRTFGIGDYLNDLEMLAAVDVAMQVQLPDGAWAEIPLPSIVRLAGIGPAGWAVGARRVIEAITR